MQGPHIQQKGEQLMNKFNAYPALSACLQPDRRVDLEVTGTR